MLTSDLVPVRTKKGVIMPRYVDPDDPALQTLARRFIAAFEANVGRRRGALDEAVADIVGDNTDLLLRKGLVKLIEDRCTFEVSSPVDPMEVRALVFSMAARVHPVTLGQSASDEHEDVLMWSDGGLSAPELVPDVLEVETDDGSGPVHPIPQGGYTHRRAVLVRAGERLGLSPEAVLDALYADLAENHRLQEMEPIEPLALLHRYNLALAQAVLFKATRLTIEVRGATAAQVRAVFRAIKFHRLMYRIERKPKGVYVIELDGPVSLFKASSRYGLQMAVFLPALLVLAQWKLEAELSWGQRRDERRFKLDHKAGLVTPKRQKGQYQTQEERWFVERFEALDTPWKLDLSPPLLQCGGQDLVIPDVALRHPDGRVAYMEVLGFWRKGSLLGRVEQLRRHDLGHLILAVSKNMQSSVEALGEVPAEVVYFREIIPPREVIAKAELVARAE